MLYLLILYLEIKGLVKGNRNGFSASIPVYMKVQIML